MNQMSGTGLDRQSLEGNYVNAAGFRDKRIFSTGCAGMSDLVSLACTVAVDTFSIVEEQLRMNDCYYDKKDWRACKKEVSLLNPNLFCVPEVALRWQLLILNGRWNFSGNAGNVKAMNKGQKARMHRRC